MRMVYPINVCNVSHASERWQIDTGPVLLPDFSASPDAALAGMRPGHLVYNDWTWTEYVRRRLLSSDAVVPGSQYSAPVRLSVANRIFALES